MLPPTPSIQRLPYSAPRADFISALKKDGCVIIQNFTNLDTLAQAQREVRPYLDGEDKGSKVGALEGRTKTCTRLIGRSKTVREQFFADPLYQDLVEHFLSLETRCWYGNEPSVNVSHPLLSIAITMDVQPGTPAQRLHRDDKNHHARHAPVDAYHPNRDMLMGLFVPGCDTHRENGATRVVPGSHLWGDEQPDFGPDGTKGVVDACLNAGEAFVMLGSLYHGGGEYSQKDGSRTVHIMFCCSGVYRQEEISFLSYPIEDVRSYPHVVKDRLGWKQSEPNLGWVDLRSPEYLLE
ncbi:phytanoyl-dioxygenase family protein [Botryosphaeria dothidea]|uniref:Phytanoyl-dioxygenase family protein n=1 Tax=Botryosphaeria dothidea TaxID=55169 RepID=A0A8H4J246_9PEZI|nr:phytanoyl-dioxygenase family protein [Botryosphaeria dothidea]